MAEPERLSPAARSTVGDPATELLVSAASAWEIAIKTRLGKLPGGERLLDCYQEHVLHLRADEVDITRADALLAGSLRWTHRDPFDRVLAAQAMARGIVLVTVDRAFDALPGLRPRW